MTDRRIGWAFSAERPVSVQSRSMMPLTDIQTRLNFSSVNSPTLPKKRALITMSRIPHTPLAITPPTRNMNARLADYHMSKQNPDVLDRMYSSSLPSSPQNSHLANHMISPSPYHSGSGSTNSSPGVLFQSRISHTPNQSLLRQTLKASKAQTSSKSSLVQLATQRGSSIRLNNVSTISPVLVKLSRGSDTPPSAVRSTSELTMPTVSETGVIGLTQSGDPCDRDTVLTALRSKRKHWESSGVITPTLLEQPSAKRPNVQPDAPITTEPLTSRKRPPTNIETASSDNKRSKVIRPTPRKTNRICMPDIEFDCSSETSQSEIAIITKVVVSTNKSEEKASVMRTPVPSVEKRGPPVLSANEELVKKREDSLSMLRAVFPSHNSEKSLRREVPVFCASGQKPHMPSLLSSAHTATRADLLKDREAAAERITQLLSFSSSSPSTTHTETKPKPSLPDCTKVTDGNKPAAQISSYKVPITISDTPSTVSSTTINSTKDGLKVPAPPSKNVSFASPLTSNIPSNTNAVTTTAVSVTPLPGIKLSQGATAGLSNFQSPSSAAKSVGDLSLLSSTSTQPVPTQLSDAGQTSTQALVPTLKLNTAISSNKSGILTGGLAFGVTAKSSESQISTTATGIQFSVPASTQSAGGIVTTAKTQTSTGLQIGALNTTSANLGLQIGSTMNSSMSGARMGPLTTASLGNKPSTTTGTGIGPLITPTLGGILQSTTNTPSLQVPHQPPTTTISSLTQQAAVTQTLNVSLPLPGLTTQSMPALSFGQQSQSGGLSLGNISQGIGSLNAQNSNSKLSFGTLQPTGLFGNIATTASLQSTGGIMFGNTPTTVTATQQQRGNELLFGNSLATNTASQQLSSNGFSIGTNMATTTPVQSGGLLFGNIPNSTVTSQQQNGGFLFGKTITATTTNDQPSGGLLFGKTMTATTTNDKPSGGLLFGSKPTNSLQTQQASSGPMFGNISTTISSGLQFGTSQSTQNNSLFGFQAPKDPPKLSGLLFGNTAIQNASNSQGQGSMGSNTTQQQGLFSGGNSNQLSQTLNFGANQTQSNMQTNLAFGAGLNSNNQPKQNSIFGNNSSLGAQSQSNNLSGFNFTSGSNPQSTGQTSFGMGQPQNGNGNSLFTFKANTGMNSGQETQNSTGFSFGASAPNMLNSNQSLSGGNIFKSPQPGSSQPPNFTPQQSTPQQGFNFSASTPSQFNFGVGTPIANSFTPGTTGSSTPRPTGRFARRRRGRK